MSILFEAAQCRTFAYKAVEHPLVSDNDLNGGQELEDATEDAESITSEPDHQAGSPSSVTDGQLCGRTASIVSPNRAQRLPSQEGDIAMSQGE